MPLGFFKKPGTNATTKKVAATAQALFRPKGGHVETVQHLPRVQQTSAATVKAKPQRRVALREQSTQGVPQLTSRPPDRRQGAKPTGKISSTRGQLGAPRPVDPTWQTASNAFKRQPPAAAPRSLATTGRVGLKTVTKVGQGGSEDRQTTFMEMFNLA